jgi:hypothetical protein
MCGCAGNANVTRSRGGFAALGSTCVAAKRSGLLILSFAALAACMSSHAENKLGTEGGRASIDLRIIVPVTVRANVTNQPERILIEDRDLALGYIDMDMGTPVRLTSNSRDGYQLAASYDTALLSKVEVQISNQQLTASAGRGSMRVASGLAIDKPIPVRYRFHLAPGVRSGTYRWPVSLVFSPTPV